MDPVELRRYLDELVTSPPASHVEWLTIAAAIVSEALRDRQLEATLVGGGAVEFYDPGGYTTSDIDLVVERRGDPSLVRDEIDDTLRPLGFERRGRHWVRGDLFVEVPSTHLSDPTDVFDIGPFRLRVLRKEMVLGYRVVGFKHWRYTGYGAQALDMLGAFGGDLDEELLREFLRTEDAEDALDALEDTLASGTAVDDALLRRVLARLHHEEGTDETL
jgi:hypothetical protein